MIGGDLLSVFCHCAGWVTMVTHASLCACYQEVFVFALPVCFEGRVGGLMFESII